MAGVVDKGSTHARRGFDNVVRIRSTYDVRLKAKALAQAQHIAQRREVTEGEAVKQSLSVMNFLVDELDAGATFWVRDASGNSRQVEFIFS